MVATCQKGGGNKTVDRAGFIRPVLSKSTHSALLGKVELRGFAVEQKRGVQSRQTARVGIQNCFLRVFFLFIYLTLVLEQ